MAQSGSFQGSRVLLLVAVGVMAWSQSSFWVRAQYSTYYIGRASRYSLPNAGTPVNTELSPEINGWSAHPAAAVLLCVLAALFIFGVNLGPGWMRWRYWIACAVLVACMVPFHWDGVFGSGQVLGILALVIAVIAAFRSPRPA